MASRCSFVEIAKLNLKTPLNAKICGKIMKVSTSKGNIIVELQDQTGSIEVTLSESVAKNATGLLKINTLLSIENFLVKTSSGNHGRLELGSLKPFSKFKTVVTKLADPVMIEKFEWRKIPHIKDMGTFPLRSFTDVMGVIVDIGEPTIIKPKNGGAETRKMEIKLLDISNKKITVTFWGKDIDRFTHSLHSIIIIRNAEIGFWCGPNLTFRSKSSLEVNPESKNAKALQKWYNRKRAQVSSSSAGKDPSQYHSVNDVIQEQNPEKFRIISLNVRAVALTGDISKPVEKHFYGGCSEHRCNKKLVKGKTGRFCCEKCKKSVDSFTNCIHVPTQFADSTGAIFATVFKNHLENLVPISFNSLYVMAKADKECYLNILDRFLMGRELLALFKVESDEGALQWSLLCLKTPPNSGNMAKLVPESETEPLEQSADALSPYLGIIEDVDLVPASFREEQQSKVKN